MLRRIAALGLGMSLILVTSAFGQTPDAPPPPAPPAPTHRTHHVTHHAEDPDVEVASGRLQLKEDAWAYGRPSRWSKTIERVHAPKFVIVTGWTPHYIQIKLKNGETGYISPAAVNLVSGTDKEFMLTTDSPVYSAPNRFGKKLAEVHRGHNVHVIGIALNYLKIRMKEGIEGFIPETAVE